MPPGPLPTSQLGHGAHLPGPLTALGPGGHSAAGQPVSWPLAHQCCGATSRRRDETTPHARGAPGEGVAQAGPGRRRGCRPPPLSAPPQPLLQPAPQGLGVSGPSWATTPVSSGRRPGGRSPTDPVSCGSRGLSVPGRGRPHGPAPVLSPPPCVCGLCVCWCVPYLGDRPVALAGPWHVSVSDKVPDGVQRAL